MPKENAVSSEDKIFEEERDESFDLNELEEKLQNELAKELSDLEFLKEEEAQIGSPDALGETIKNIVWEQFLNQVAVTAGEEFIKDNRDLLNRGEIIDRSMFVSEEDVERYRLDLSKDAHIQTTENFKEGKIASHNSDIDFQKRYNDWQGNFQKDPNIEHKTNNFRYNEEQEVWEKHDTRSGFWKKVLNRGARADFDKGRPTGSNTAKTNMDHTVSAGEIIRDPGANAHMTREEQIAFANSEKNLNLMDSAANQSKGDSTMSEFLDSERNGQKAAERFAIDEESHRKTDALARDEFENKKKQGEARSVQAGKKSQKEEAFRIGKNALRTVAIQLLAELIKEIISKLVNWFKNTKRNIYSLIENLKTAIKSFVSKLKNHMVNTGITLLTTIVTAIIGPTIAIIKRTWMMLKQGWKSLKEAIDFLKNPKNKSMPMSLKLLEVGKIVMAGLSGVGALILGEVIEKGLLTIPIFAVEIPLLGSLANVIGIFMGAVVAGIIGAIAINLIDKATEKKRKQENIEHQIDKANGILNTQYKIKIISEAQLENDKANAQTNISDRHQRAGEIMRDSFGNIMEDFVFDFSANERTIIIDEEDFKTTSELDRVSDDLDDLLKSIE